MGRDTCSSFRKSEDNLKYGTGHGYLNAPVSSDLIVLRFSAFNQVSQSLIEINSVPRFWTTSSARGDTALLGSSVRQNSYGVSGDASPAALARLAAVGLKHRMSHCEHNDSCQCHPPGALEIELLGLFNGRQRRSPS